MGTQLLLKERQQIDSHKTNATFDGQQRSHTRSYSRGYTVADPRIGDPAFPSPVPAAKRYDHYDAGTLQTSKITHIAITDFDS